VFDRIVVVDWSANSTPRRGADSIWIAVADVDDDVAAASENIATRSAAIDRITALVADRRAARTLVGVDVSLGFPAGTATALGCGGVPWEATWSLLDELIVDDDRNRNNRFEAAAELNKRQRGQTPLSLLDAAPGPFWGCPAGMAGAHLAPTKPASFGALGEWRHTEEVLREAGARPFSVWQLLGAGAVGGQTLLAIPWLSELRRRHGLLDVWPFTTGLRPPEVAGGGAVLVEVWPSMFPVAAGAPRDRVQVEATAARLAAADRTGELPGWFHPPVTSAQRDVVEREEGWVLGAGVTGAEVG